MKKYIIPVINISVFERENVVTESIKATSAFEQAQKNMQEQISESNNTFMFTVQFKE